jgi:hypothetical protein
LVTGIELVTPAVRGQGRSAIFCGFEAAFPDLFPAV